MKVAKFGGTSLADAKQFRKVRELIVSDPQRRIIVVSAPGKRSREDVKITDLLIQCACLKLSGRDAGGEVSRVIARYQAIAEELELPPEWPRRSAWISASGWNATWRTGNGSRTRSKPPARRIARSS